MRANPQPLPEVIGIGAATHDRFALVDSFPSAEGVTEVADWFEDGGGPVATALCVLARMGRSCLLVDRFGADEAGRRIRADLRAHGVMTDAIRSVSGETSSAALILVRKADGARHILFSRSSAGEPGPEELRPEWFQSARLLHLNGRHEQAARAAVHLAREHDVPISFDGGAGRYRPSLRDLVKASHLRIVARDFAEQFSGQSDPHKAAAALMAEGPARLVVITDGVKGSHVWNAAGASFHQPAFPALPAVVDTTGCGDVYHGVFLHEWLQGSPAHCCAEQASRLAALNATGLGGRHGLRTAPEIG